MQVSFHFIFTFLGGLPFSIADFQGPSFYKKKYIQAKIQSYNIDESKDRKSSKKLKEKNELCYASRAFSFTFNVR